MRGKIENKLLELGITPNLKGFEYIAEAAEYILTHKNCLMRDVYSDIAGKYEQCTYARAERAIRHAISKIDKDKWCKIGGKNTKNSEFLYTLVFIIQREEENELLKQ